MQRRFNAETRIVLGKEVIRPVQRAAAYLQAQVAQRSGWQWQIVQDISPTPDDIVLGIPGDGVPVSPLSPESEEEIALWSAPGPATSPAYALAGGPSVALAVAGRLVRAMRLEPGLAELPVLSLRQHPAFPVRGHTYANHRQNTTYDKWSYAQWEEYLTEMAAWGDNVAILYPLHPTRWPGALPFADPPYFDDPKRAQEYQRQMEIQLRLPGLCHELGMRYGIWLCVNDVFPEEVERHPEITKYGHSYVCPNIPEARRRIRALRDRLFAMLPALDILFLPSKDEGGCPACADCTPWGPVYMELVQEQIQQARRYHPDCVVWMAQQGLSTMETEGLVQWLDRERPDWVEGVAYGPFSELMSYDDGEGTDSPLSLERYAHSGMVSGPISRLRGAVPGQYRLILYPDETHTYKCQYPVIGMDRTLQYIWEREDGPAPRPREMAAKQAATAPASDGAVPYSEGNTDDVNKVIWSALNWQSDLTAEQVVAQYAAWYFGPDCAPDAAAIILHMEEVLNASPYGHPAVAEMRALVQACEERRPDLLENWRWLNLRIGVLMLDHIQQVMARDRDLLAQVRYRAAVWRTWIDPAPGLRQTVRFLERRFAETNGLLAEIVWTRERLFDLHKLAIRGVARLQNSYIKMDLLLEEWRSILARLDEGELQDFPERYAAILRPLLVIENEPRRAAEGVALVSPLQEFPWHPHNLS
jgi:hypothetical protein